MGAITKPTAAAGTSGLTLAQLQAEATNQGELDTSLSAISQAVATLGSQLQSAGAVPGELRVFNTTTAPEGWVEKDRNGAPPLAITYGRRDIQCAPRAYTTNTGNIQSSTVAGEYNGYVYYVYTLATGQAYSAAFVEKMNIATGQTSFVIASAVNSYSSTAGTYCGSSAIVGNTLYLFGGRDSNNYAQPTTYKLNLDNVASGWSTTHSMTSVNSGNGLGVAVSGGRIYAIGGVVGDLTTSFSSYVRVFDTATMTWSKLAATLPFGPAENVQTVTLADGNILCVGGYSGSVELKKYSVLNTTTGLFGPVYDLPANWLDRPRSIMRSPGQSIVRGFCFTDNITCTVVEFDGTSWINTGRVAVFNNCVMGNLGLSDGSSFSPATLTSYKVPHVQHMHPLGSAARMLCAKL